MPFSSKIAVHTIGSMQNVVKALCLVAAVMAFNSCSTFARASSFNFGAVSVGTISPSADTLSFNAASGTISAGGTFTQTGAWTINDSGSLNQYIALTFNDTVTINNITRVLTFSGGLNVTPSADTLTIAALAPVMFGDLSVSFAGFSVSDGNLETLPVTLAGSATAVTGEPSSLLLMGTGLLSMTLWMGIRARTLSRREITT